MICLVRCPAKWISLRSRRTGCSRECLVPCATGSGCRADDGGRLSRRAPLQPLRRAAAASGYFSEAACFCRRQRISRCFQLCERVRPCCPEWPSRLLSVPPSSELARRPGSVRRAARRPNSRHHCRTQPASENISPLSSSRLMAAWEMSTKVGLEICQRLLRGRIGAASGSHATSAEREKRPAEWLETGRPDRRISVILPVVALSPGVLRNAIRHREKRPKRQRQTCVDFRKCSNRVGKSHQPVSPSTVVRRARHMPVITISFQVFLLPATPINKLPC